MTGELTALATALEAVEGAEWEVAAGYVPEELSCPSLVLVPGEDYLTAGDTFHQWVLNLELYVLVDLVGNQQAAEDLDTALASVLGLLARSVWSVNNMSKPGPLHTTNWLAHGARLQISTETTLTHQE